MDLEPTPTASSTGRGQQLLLREVACPSACRQWLPVWTQVGAPLRGLLQICIIRYCSLDMLSSGPSLSLPVQWLPKWMQAGVHLLAGLAALPSLTENTSEITLCSSNGITPSIVRACHHSCLPALTCCHYNRTDQEPACIVPYSCCSQ